VFKDSSALVNDQSRVATESLKRDESLSRQEIVQFRPVQVCLPYESRHSIVLINIIIEFFDESTLSSKSAAIEMVMAADRHLDISALNPSQMN
jgi:hypothetical protein